MPMHNFRKLLPVSLLALVIATIPACATQADEEFSCSVPTTKNVAEAFAHTKNDLTHPECQFQFDAYVDTLLQKATDDPGTENKQRFSELFAFARDEGILSEAQATRKYRRYFTPDFVTLNDLYNNCSTTCQDTDQVRRELRDELEDKDLGLLRVAGDQESYSQADTEYNQLLTLIEAACRTCQEQ